MRLPHDMLSAEASGDGIRGTVFSSLDEVVRQLLDNHDSMVVIDVRRLMIGDNDYVSTLYSVEMHDGLRARTRSRHEQGDIATNSPGAPIDPAEPHTERVEHPVSEVSTGGVAKEPPPYRSVDDRTVFDGVGLAWGDTEPSRPLQIIASERAIRVQYLLRQLPVPPWVWARPRASQRRHERTVWMTYRPTAAPAPIAAAITHGLFTASTAAAVTDSVASATG